MLAYTTDGDYLFAMDTALGAAAACPVRRIDPVLPAPLKNRVLGNDLATIDLAQAIVGPNVTTIVDPDCTEPDGCDTGGVTVTPPGGGGGPGAGSLAYTGIGIATLIAVILALLAAGAYLVRESYRRNHPVVTTTA